MRPLDSVRRPGSGTVLVLGSDTRSFLAVVRSLGRKGLQVHVGWCPPGAPALHSRYIARVHALPPYTTHDDAWKRSLVSVLRQERFDLVIPCDDPTVLPLQLHRAELEEAGRLYLLDEMAFAVTASKLDTAELARRLGVPVPREYTATALDDADEILARFPLPVVLKPRSSYGIEDLKAKRAVRTVHSATELCGSLSELLPHGPVQVQEHFPGTGVGIEVLARDGEILFAFQHQRIHEPLAGGGSSYRKSVPLDRDLLRAAERLMGALRYTGVGMVEFRVDLRSGAWILVEINGRFWGSLPLAVAAGADFPRYLYEMLVEGRREFPPGYREGLYGRNWLKDAVWLRQGLQVSGTALAVPTHPLRQVAAEMWNVLTLRERSDTLVLDDPRPAAAEIGGILRTRVARSMRRVRAGWPRVRSGAAQHEGNGRPAR